MDEKIKAQEQQRVNQVVGQIKQRLIDQQVQLDKAHRETKSVERNYGDNTRVNITEADDRIETNAAVQQQKQLVSRAVETESILKQQMGQLKDLAKSPYFGRIDINEDGDQDTLYIGTASFIDNQQNFLVYDWRAPISGIYYNGTLGPVHYATPNGQATAELLKKRQFQINDGEIINVFDTNETVGDQMLQAVLGSNNAEAMQNIVATIQQEQNDIIRDTRHDVLVVQGVAGSGKTSAILQRIAFLLYHSRESLNSEQMLLFSPNKLFSHYISEVLPSLGEKNMRQVTLAEFLNARFSGLKVESLFERFEQDQHSLPKTTQQLRQYKESAAYLTAIDHYLKQAQPQQLCWNAIYFEGKVFFSAAEIQAIYAALPQNLLAADKFLATKNTLIKRLKQRIRELAQADWVLEEVDVLSENDYQNLVGTKRFRSADAEVQFVARALMRQRLEIVYNAIYNDYFIDTYAQYAAFMRANPAPNIAAATWATMVTTYEQQLERHQIRLADAAPILYLRDQLTGSGQNHAMQYLFIDEMQDYSAAQLLYIKHAFPNCKITLLGDRDQDLFQRQQVQWPALFAGQRLKQITLNKSYRSTKQITEFAAGLLPNGGDIQAFTREGPQPQVLQGNTLTTCLQLISQQIQRLLDQHETIAILTKDQATSAELYAHLQLNVETTLMTDSDRALPKGVLILPIYLAKGLEFDTVIAYNVNATEFSLADYGLLYTIATRAMHELVLISQGPVSPLIKQAAPETFELNA